MLVVIWIWVTTDDIWRISFEAAVVIATCLCARRAHGLQHFPNLVTKTKWFDMGWVDTFYWRLFSFKTDEILVNRAQEMESALSDTFEDDDVDDDDEDEFGLFTIPGYRYKCTYSNCELRFKRKDQLDSHVYIHTRRKKFPCTFAACDKSYVNKAHLQRHIRTFHRPKKDNTGEGVACKSELCSLKFESDLKMLEHFQRSHAEAKPFQYKCDYCGAEFYRKFHLRLHLVSHTGHYPYKCVQCDKGFIRMSLLKRHEKMHKSYDCNHCAAVFTKWSQLVAHKHKEHATIECKCSQCGRVFHSRRGLKCHEKVHVETDERTVFQCTFDLCPKFFFHRRNLLAHQKSKHSGNRRFVCTVVGCERQLSTKQKLDQHVNSVHANSDKKIKTVEKTKTRAPRKDKGLPKTSTAAKILGLIAPKEVEHAILTGQGNSIYFQYDHRDSGDEELRATECTAEETSQILEMAKA